MVGHRRICDHVEFVSCQLHYKTQDLPPADTQFLGQGQRPLYKAQNQ